MGSLEQVNGESNPMAAFDVKKDTPTNNTHEGFDLENQKQQLLWVILFGMIFALIIQSLAANLGVSTEAAVIAADIPEGMELKMNIPSKQNADLVIGTAFGLNILFHIPVWAGVLLTGLSTLLLLGLQRYGIRKLELLVAIMVFTMAACFFVEMGMVKPPATDMLRGLFIPKLSGQSATGDAIALLGALIMPHNLFLHSALVLSRKIPNSVHGIKDVCRYYLMETGFALSVALLINIAVTSVSATVCSDPNLSDQCNTVTLNSASFLLQNVLKKSSSTIYGVALLASGQSSTITCTYAGQFIMQMVLSFELPFSLIPLLKFSSSTSKMGPYKGSIYIIVISWILGLAIICANIYFLSTSFVGWMIHSTLPKVATVFVAILVFPIMVVYVASVIYLMWRKDTVVTYIDTTKNDSAVQSGTEDGEDSIVPFREDLADIPLPE
ncbi:hypothetical protein RHMOL_Rhmol09G0020100 [Rhododendron molle]|uniref:Uncharacterized protein n=1 Tax=Rhododendron molle TaxID=49168 RepID=A0ACC0M8S3_RHOML|nr:hypothetical protein RHMOL_Rhmol09G0020100 [Rhododendron molle]